MKLQCKWNEKMKFSASAGGHEVPMDTSSPIGNDSAMTPKQLLLAGVCGCTAMDVVALLKKYKQPLEAFDVEADATPSEGVHPAVYTKIHLNFKLKGALDEAKVMEAVVLSQTKYCGVSAMVSKALPITYTVDLNDKQIGQGQASF